MSTNHQEDSYSKIPTNPHSKENNTTRISTSFQQLYDLLSRKGRDIDRSNSKSRSVTKSKVQDSSHSKVKINFSYETTPLEKRVSSYEINRVTKLINTDSFNSKLEGLCKHKTSLYPTDKKYSIQTTNQKLKNIILGKRNKKAQFLQPKGYQDEAIGILPKYQRLQPINEQILMKRPIFTENSQISSFRTAENKKSQMKHERDQQSPVKIRKMKTEEAQIFKEYQFSPCYKKSKPNKRLMINGSNLIKLLKHTSKTSELKQSSRSPKKQAVQDKVSMQELINQRIKANIQEGFMSKSFSPIQKNRKTQKKESLYLNILSKLPISEHIIWKIQKMLVFNQFFLKSFGCEYPYTDPRLLNKYHKNNNFCTFYVGVGNNRSIIIQIFRKRWWWKQIASWQEAKFVWTQQKNTKIFNLLSQEKEQNIKEITEMQSLLNLPKFKQLLQKKSQKRCDKLLKKLLTHSYKTKSSLKTGSLQLKRIQRPSILCNHIQNSNILGDKKDLFTLLRMWMLQYKMEGADKLYSFIPKTYNLKDINSTVYSHFLETFIQNKPEKAIWIVKPGQNSNRGRGIFLSQDEHEIRQSVQNRFQLGGTTIIQRYKADLVLYKGRKFDIRTYMLCIIIGGNIKYYWYSQGYIRTSSHLFNLKQLNSMIHLTNDAIQNKGEMYGKYQKGNKLSYNQLQAYLNQTYPHKQFKIDSLTTKMKEIAKKVASASYHLIDKTKKVSFELFGLDFIVDSSFNPWLLEVNTNPCLQVSSPVLQNVIPTLIENVFRLTIDPLFPPNMLPDKDHEYNLPQKIIDSNKFQLIFDSQIQRDEQWQKFCDEKWQIQRI